MELENQKEEEINSDSKKLNAMTEEKTIKKMEKAERNSEKEVD